MQQSHNNNENVVAKRVQDQKLREVMAEICNIPQGKATREAGVRFWKGPDFIKQARGVITEIAAEEKNMKEKSQ